MPAPARAPTAGTIFAPKVASPLTAALASLAAGIFLIASPATFNFGILTNAAAAAFLFTVNRISGFPPLVNGPVGGGGALGVPLPSRREAARAPLTAPVVEEMPDSLFTPATAAFATNFVPPPAMLVTNLALITASRVIMLSSTSSNFFSTASSNPSNAPPVLPPLKSNPIAIRPAMPPIPAAILPLPAIVVWPPLTSCCGGLTVSTFSAFETSAPIPATVASVFFLISSKTSIISLLLPRFSGNEETAPPAVTGVVAPWPAATPFPVGNCLTLSLLPIELDCLCCGLLDIAEAMPYPAAALPTVPAARNPLFATPAPALSAMAPTLPIPISSGNISLSPFVLFHAVRFLF